MASGERLQTTIGETGKGGAIGTGARPCLHWVYPERRHTLIEQVVVLGRAEDSTVLLSGQQVSRAHARLFRDGPLLVVEDLGSRNGTFVNGQRTARAPLASGSVLRVGNWIAVVRPLPLDDPMAEPFGEIASGLFGGSTLRRALALAPKAAASVLPIIVQGETGTGKEVLSRALHGWSGRRGPFVAVNCAAIPEGLAEAELFGHRKGAFTGAASERLGHFREANGGTLLLDEFIELPAGLQARLLRVLESGEVTPVGQSQPITIDVKVVVATQKPLAQLVNSKRLRPDLFARLDGVTLHLPALHERPEDIVPLFELFVKEHSGGLDPSAEVELVERLCVYRWPYNVRELALLARRLLTLHGHEPKLLASYLPDKMLTPDSVDAEPSQSELMAAGLSAPSQQSEASNASAGCRDQRDLDRLLEALRHNRGNVAQACEKLGLARSRAYRLLNRVRGLNLAALRKEQPK